MNDGTKSDTLIVTYGREFSEAVKAKEILEKSGVSVDIMKLNLILPLQQQAIDTALEYKNILFAEEGVSRGGVGESMLLSLTRGKFSGNFKLVAVENTIIAQGTVAEQIKILGLDGQSLAGAIMEGID